MFSSTPSSPVSSSSPHIRTLKNKHSPTKTYVKMRKRKNMATLKVNVNNSSLPVTQYDCGGGVVTPTCSSQLEMKMTKYRRKVANSKERQRMRYVNDAFDKLKKVLPEGPCSTKVATLRQAIDYINQLKQTIQALPETTNKLIIEHSEKNYEELSSQDLTCENQRDVENHGSASKLDTNDNDNEYLDSTFLDDLNFVLSKAEGFAAVQSNLVNSNTSDEVSNQRPTEHVDFHGS